MPAPLTYQIDVQATAAVANVNSVTTAVNTLTGALQTATSHLTTLLSATQGTAAATHTLTTSLGNSASAATTASSAHNALELSTLKVAAGYRLMNAAVNTTMAALASIPATGRQYEQINSTLYAIFTTTEQVNAQFKFLNDLADKTGASLAPLAETYSKFASSAIIAGESLSNVQSIFQNLTEAGTVLHLPAEKLRSALTAIDQMYGKGAVQLEELKRQLGNQLPAAVAVFARSMGVSTEELMKLTKAGAVVPKETIAAFASLYKDLFAPMEAFQSAASGMNASLGRLDTAWSRLAESIYQAVSPALLGSLQGATAALDGIRKSLEDAKNSTVTIGNTTVSTLQLIKAAWKEAKDEASSYFGAIGAAGGAVVSAGSSALGAVAQLAVGRNAQTPTASGLERFLGIDLLKQGASSGLGKVISQALAPAVVEAASSSAVLANAVAAEAAAKQAAKARALREQVLAEQRKALLADPGGAEDAGQTAKSLNKELELVGKVAQTELAHTSAVAKRELAVLEVERARIDRAWQNTQMSITDHYERQLELINRAEAIELKKLERQGQILALQEAQTQSVQQELAASEGNDTVLARRKDKLMQASQALAQGLALLVPDRSPGNAPSQAAINAVAAARTKYNASSGASAIPDTVPLVMYASEQLAETKKLREMQEKSAGIHAATGGLGRGSSTEDIKQAIVDAATRYGVPAGFALAIAKQESGFHQYGKGGGVLTSSAGAHGVMQLMPGTAKAYGGGDGSDTYLNIEAGVRYLAKLLAQFHGNAALAAAGYNAGENRASLRAGNIPNIPETQQYVRAVMANMGAGGEVLRAGGSSSLASATVGMLKAQAQAAGLTEQAEEVRTKSLMAREELAARRTAQERDFVKSLEGESLAYAKLTGLSQEQAAIRSFDLQTQERLTKYAVELASALRNGASERVASLQAAQAEAMATREILAAQARMKDLQGTAGSMQTWLSGATSAAGKGETEWGAAWKTQAAARSLAPALLGNLHAQMGLVQADASLGAEAKAVRLQELFGQVKALEEATDALSAKLEGRFASSISDAFMAWTEGTKTAKDALRGLGIEFTRMLEKMLLDELAMQAAKGITSGLGSIGSAVLGAFGFAGGGAIPAYAPGGLHLRGSGTGLSDGILSRVPAGSFVVRSGATSNIGASTLARLSSGEFLVPPAATAAFGTGFWNSLNSSGQVPGFAAGGWVGGGGGSPVGVSSAGHTFNVVVNATGAAAESPEAVGQAVTEGMVRAIAKAEAEKATRVADKLRGRRGGVG